MFVTVAAAAEFLTRFMEFAANVVCGLLASSEMADFNNSFNAAEFLTVSAGALVANVRAVAESDVGAIAVAILV